MARSIGLHARINENILDVLKKAIELETDIVQCFLIRQNESRHVILDQNDVDVWLDLRRQHFKELFLHASYWINLSGLKNNGFHIFEKELEYAKRLEFTHIVIHPGSATGSENKYGGIDCLAKSLNLILEKENTIKIVLENAAHAKKTVAGSLNDFKILLEKLDKPEMVGFCIDTAHAFSYGYNLTTIDGYNNFFKELINSVPKNQMSLIHLNDTDQGCAKHIDKHATIGSGLIGENILKAFASNDFNDNVPIILEMPAVSLDEEKRALNLVRSWNLK